MDLQNKYFCPLCFKDKKSLRKIIEISDDCFICDNDDCSFNTEKVSELLFNENGFNDDNIKTLESRETHFEIVDLSNELYGPMKNVDTELSDVDIVKLFESDVDKFNSESEALKFEQFKSTILNESSSNYAHENINCNAQVTLDNISHIHGKRDSLNIFRNDLKIDPKCHLFTQNVEERLSRYLLEYSNKFFNWLTMPMLLKTHSKIVRLLMLHLDDFGFDNSEIDELKILYFGCETVANHFKLDCLKSSCFPFLSKLCRILPKLPKELLFEKEMDSRVLSLMRLMFEKYDPSESLKSKFSISGRCENCCDSRKVEKSDYFFQLDDDVHCFNLQKSGLSYKQKCLTCNAQLKKIVSFTDIPNCLIIHTPNGLKKWRDAITNKIVSAAKNKLSLVAVIECQSNYPFTECPERDLTEDMYSSMLHVKPSKSRPKFCVNIRNADGWYQLNYREQVLCKPTDLLELHNPSFIRILVFGTMLDPRKYRRQFSIKEYIPNFDASNKETLMRLFGQHSSEDDILKLVEVPNVKERKKRIISKKPERKEMRRQKLAARDKRFKAAFPEIVMNSFDETALNAYIGNSHRTSSGVSSSSGLEQTFDGSLTHTSNSSHYSQSTFIDDIISKKRKVMETNCSTLCN